MEFSSQLYALGKNKYVKKSHIWTTTTTTYRFSYRRNADTSLVAACCYSHRVSLTFALHQRHRVSIVHHTRYERVRIHVQVYVLYVCLLAFCSPVIVVLRWFIFSHVIFTSIEYTGSRQGDLNSSVLLHTHNCLCVCASTETLVRLEHHLPIFLTHYAQRTHKHPRFHVSLWNNRPIFLVIAWFCSTFPHCVEQNEVEYLCHCHICHTGHVIEPPCTSKLNVRITHPYLFSVYYFIS